MAKRIFLFFAVNLLVMVTISTLLSVLGVTTGFSAQGINYESLMIFCLIWGMGGSIISLLISRIMAKMMMGVQVIPENTNDPELRWLLQTVHRMAKSSGITTMPQVGIYENPEVNAFATGPTKNRSLVACSTGLLRRMNKDQVEGVIGHEVAHISNGDMVTLTLIQGIVNAFAMFLSRIAAWALSQNVREESRHTVYFITSMVLDILLTFLGMIVVAYFSRLREFRADAGGSRFAGRDKMIGALRALKGTTEAVDDEHPALASLKISGRGGFMRLFSTHPPLEERLARLESGRAL
ncbi:MAG: protease HtpX [Bdellovibrionales bacterium]